jgi:dCMP deaminase
MINELVYYYNSSDADVTLARGLINQLEAIGVQLNNNHKNEIVKTIQQIYAAGTSNGQVKTAYMIKKVAENHGEVLPPATTQYVDAYALGHFEDADAFNRTKARISKDRYYLKIAEAVLERSTCLRRRYGAVIVKDDEVIATGYNGSPRGETNCIDAGFCNGDAYNVPKGERYELCSAVHAEQNACLSAARKDTIGATIYIVGREVRTWEYADPEPCLICRKMIKQMGIKRVVGFYKGQVVEFDV